MRNEGAGRGLIDLIGGAWRGRASGGLVAALSLALLLGCERSEPEAESVVDPALFESIPGLTTDDRVHVVLLRFGSPGEALDPDSLAIEAGDWVDFRSDDGSPRVVNFVMESMAPEKRTFLEVAGAGGSPPLVAPGSHWVVSFHEAPPGPYPFTVQGARAPARGVIYVAGPG